jgi:hypothetical protein
VGNTGHYPLVLDPTIAGMTITKVLIDGGAGLNIIFFDMLRTIPFYGIVPDEVAMPLGHKLLYLSHLEALQITALISSSLRWQISNHHITLSLGCHARCPKRVG